MEEIYIERPGKHRPKGYLDRQKTNASQEAGGNERRSREWQKSQEMLNGFGQGMVTNLCL